MKWFSRERVSVFSEPERLVLDAVRTKLSPDLWSIFDEHINTVNLVQRHADGREVNMYRMHRGKVTLPQSRFTADDSEYLLATVVLKSESVKPRITAKVWVVNGNLFQIMFNAPMKRLNQLFHVASVELPAEVAVQEQWRRWRIPDDLSRFGQITDEAQPLSEQRRADALAWISLPLPRDYLDLMLHVDGFRIKHWVVLGLESVYETPGMPGTYVLAESRTGDPNQHDQALLAGPDVVLTISLAELEEEARYGPEFIPALIATLETGPTVRFF